MAVSTSPCISVISLQWWQIEGCDFLSAVCPFSHPLTQVLTPLLPLGLFFLFLGYLFLFTYMYVIH